MEAAAQRHALLARYPVWVTIPIQWGEMDAYGHVNNAMFFRYFESARIAFLDRCGFLASYEEEGVGAILHSTDCRFRRALFYPDTIQVGARHTDVRADRFTNAYRVVSMMHDEIIAEGTGVVVSFDYRARVKTGLPERVRRTLDTLGAP